MFKNPFSFNGRIRRLEYGLSYLSYLIFIFLAELIADVPGGVENPLIIIGLLLAYLFFIWFLLAQGAKRCHDRGNPGVWQIIPFYGFWMLFADGDIGDNEYGLNPKGMYWDDDNIGDIDQA